ncbi:MAG: tetratricopeptide repeat protein [Acidobacteriota bacterium]|nr:tetratricopeptide repeat protein [Acidobacteriota bacterium]
MRLLLLLLVWAIPAFVQAQTDEEKLRVAVGRYFDAYAKEDWEAFAAVWHERSPMLGARFNVMKAQFAAEDFSFNQPSISRLKIEGDKASLRVAITRTAKNRTTNNVRLTEVRTEMVFVRENGEWRLWTEASPVSELLNTLADAKNDDERRKILSEDKELVTRELLFLLSGTSDRAYTQADYARALRLLQSAVLVAETIGDKNEQANAWHNMGIIHFVQNRPEPALEAYRASLRIEEELGRKPEIARSINSVALVLMAQGKFAESVESYQRALAIYQSLDRKADMAQTLENIGNAFYEQGDLIRSTEFYQQSVKQLEALDRPGPAAHRMLKIARIELEQGHDAMAIEVFQQAANKLSAAGDRRTLGYVFHSIANILYDQGDYNQALTFYNRSLQAERAAGTREGEAGALQGIGLIHSLNGNYSAALDAYTRNLALVQALNNKADTAVAWQKLGGTFYSLGKLDESLEAYKSALALREQLGDDQETAFALLDVGVTLTAKREFAEALKHYARSRELYAKAGNSTGIAAVLLNTSLVHYLTSDWPMAVQVATLAADFAKRGEDQDLFWQARHRSGKAHYRLNDLASARKAMTEAIAVIETMRPPAARNQQPRYYENKIAPYLAMVDVALSEGQGNEAFHFTERAKARVLTGLLQNAKTRIVKTMTAREQERERQLLAEITAVNAQVYREQERQKKNPARIAELKIKLQKAQTDYADFRARLYALHPLLKTLRGELKPITVEQVAPLVTDAKTALLEFVETDERVYLFVFGKDKPKNAKATAAQQRATLNIFILDTVRTDLYQRMYKFHQAIAARSEDANASARELYDLLLKPAAAALEGKTQLIIAPDVVSWGLPFQALRSDAERYLIEDFAVSYTPSLTIFNAVTTSRIPAPVVRSAGARPPAQLALLAVGNPAISPEATDLLKTVLAVPPNESSEIGKEIEAAFAEFGQLYGADQSLLLAGAGATEDRIKKEFSNARVIQFAAQGIHHEASPLFSLLAVTPNQENREDGLLELREVLRLEMNADLVIAAGSDWAAPRTLTNRAMTAWSWAWFVAGSRSALLGQWRTESSANTELLIEFHRQLKADKGRSAKSVVWRNAVQNLLVKPENRHPFFWAGFTMLGNGK